LYYLGALCLAGLWGASFSAGALVLVAAPFGIFFAFYSASLAVALEDSDSANQMQNAMRQTVNELGKQNDKLTQEREKLTGEVDRVGEIEAKLANIAEAQGANVSKLVNLVKRNKRYLKEMRQIEKSLIVQKLVELVIESDKDGDYNIDADECEILILRMNNFRSYIKVNKKNFKAELDKTGGSVAGIMNIVKTILDPDADKIPVDKRIFVIDPNLGQLDKGKAKKK